MDQNFNNDQNNFNNQSINNQNFNQGMGGNPQPVNQMNNGFPQQPVEQPLQPQSISQQPVMQEPIPQPLNAFAGNVNNESFNSKPPKKTNLGLITGIVVAIAVIIVGIIFGGKLFGKNNQDISNDGNKNIENKEYIVGDKISFNNEYWYVIKNSDKNSNYVVAIKETILNNKMQMLESYDNALPFDAALVSKNIAHYSESLIKSYLEDDYINELGANNLAEVDGYKIRLITASELCNLVNGTSETEESIQRNGCFLYNKENTKNAPEWTYSASIVGTDNYWTMTDGYTGGNYQVKDLTSSSIGYARVNYEWNSDLENPKGIRPVINLLKTSIK